MHCNHPKYVDDWMHCNCTKALFCLCFCVCIRCFADRNYGRNSYMLRPETIESLYVLYKVMTARVFFAADCNWQIVLIGNTLQAHIVLKVFYNIVLSSHCPGHRWSYIQGMELWDIWGEANYHDDTITSPLLESYTKACKTSQSVKLMDFCSLLHFRFMVHNTGYWKALQDRVCLWCLSGCGSSLKNANKQNGVLLSCWDTQVSAHFSVMLCFFLVLHCC